MLEMFGTFRSCSDYIGSLLWRKIQLWIHILGWGQHDVADPDIRQLRGPKSIAKLDGIHGRIFPLWICYWANHS